MEKTTENSLVNETFRYRPETRPRHLFFRPRRDRDQDHPTIHRDRDETETWKIGLETVSRPRRRDRDVETETTTLSWSSIRYVAYQSRQTGLD